MLLLFSTFTFLYLQKMTTLFPFLLAFIIALAIGLFLGKLLFSANGKVQDLVPIFKSIINWLYVLCNNSLGDELGSYQDVASFLQMFVFAIKNFNLLFARSEKSADSEFDNAD